MSHFSCAERKPHTSYSDLLGEAKLEGDVVFDNTIQDVSLAVPYPGNAVTVEAQTETACKLSPALSWVQDCQAPKNWTVSLIA